MFHYRCDFLRERYATAGAARHTRPIGISLIIKYITLFLYLLLVVTVTKPSHICEAKENSILFLTSKNKIVFAFASQMFPVCYHWYKNAITFVNSKEQQVMKSWGIFHKSTKDILIDFTRSEELVHKPRQLFTTF